MRPGLARVGLLLFLSGLCSLVYQVAWLRLLRLVFGSSTASTAAVLAIFMGGLGFGGLWLGRRAQRSRHPMRFYAGLELGITVSAAASPLLIDLVRVVYLGLGGVGSLGLPLATAIRLALSILILGVPTTLMGGTLPAVARALESDSDRGRRRVAWLYGLNTLGAVVGAFFAAFVWIERFGVRHTLWYAAALNLALALAARWLAGQPGFAPEPEIAPPDEARPTAPADGRAAPEPEGPRRGEIRPRLVLVVAGVVGFLFFLMEIVWYRMLAPILGGSSYTFGLILALALLGIGLGGVLYAFGPESRRPGLHALALTCGLEALCLAVPYALGDRLAIATASLRHLGAWGFTGLVVAWTAIAATVVFPAAVAAGYQFPLLVALLGSGRRAVSREVGLVYAWNTWGAILGSLAGGFGLLPLLTAPRLWRGSVMTLAGLGLLLSAAGWRRGRRAASPAGSLGVSPAPVFAVLAIVFGLASGPSAFWRHTPIGAGRYQIDARGPNELHEAMSKIRRSVVVEADGVESSVALIAGGDDLALVVNGKSDGAARSDAPTTVMSGLIGAILHPDPKKALVIGLGTGTTAGWLAQVPSIERVDVVELEPAVIDFARLFEPVSMNALENPKVHVLAGDGRELVLTTGDRYDVIFSEPSNPYRAGIGDFFSADFYAAAKERLRPGGVFLQWLQAYEVDAGVIETVYASLGRAFPSVETWQVNVTDLLLVASREPLHHDLARLRRRTAEEPYSSALRRVWRVEGVEGLYTGFVGDDRLARALADAAEAPSTDDRPLIEYGFARDVGRGGLFDLVDLHRFSEDLGAHRPPVDGMLDRDRIDELCLIRQTINTFSPWPLRLGDADEQARWQAREAYLRGDLAAARAAWSSQAGAPRSQVDRFLIAETEAEAADPAAEAAIAELRGQAPTEALFLEARYRLRRGDRPAARESLLAAFEGLRRDPWVFQPVAQRGFVFAEEMLAADPASTPRFLAALAQPMAVRLFEELRLWTRISIASRYGTDRDTAGLIASLEPDVPWSGMLLEARSAYYAKVGHPLADRAAADLAEFRNAEPPRLEAP